MMLLSKILNVGRNLLRQFHLPLAEKMTVRSIHSLLKRNLVKISGAYYLHFKM